MVTIEPPRLVPVMVTSVPPAVVTAVAPAGRLSEPVGAGIAGGAAGVIADDAPEAAEVPAVLIATAVSVYAVPLLRPVNWHVVAGATTVQVAPPGDAVTR